MISVLTVYNAYLNRGGEDEVFDNEAGLLEAHGHRVVRFRVEADPLRSPSLVTQSKLALATVWSREYSRTFDDLLTRERPDLVHFHNTFPLISPSAIATCKRTGVPVVHSLHNYRLVCPSATMFRGGHACADCVGRTAPWPGVVHACYRDSRPQTAVVAAMLTAHRLRGTWRHDVDRYIALTGFAKEQFVNGGLPEPQIAIKPNFVDVPSSTGRRRKPAFLYVGRLSAEEGVPTLLRATSNFPSSHALRIVGDGPLLEDVKFAQTSNANVFTLGRLPFSRVLEEMGGAQVLLFPSEWFEGFPLSIVEAFACATPVIASRLGAMIEIIEDGVTGLLFEPGNATDLAAKVRWAADHPDEMRRMGENARREYEAKYTPERNYEMLMEIYRQAIVQSRLGHAQ